MTVGMLPASATCCCREGCMVAEYGESTRVGVATPLGVPGPERLLRELLGVPTLVGVLAPEKAPRLEENVALSKSSKKEYQCGIGSEILAVSSAPGNDDAVSCVVDVIGLHVTAL